MSEPVGFTGLASSMPDDAQASQERTPHVGWASREAIRPLVDQLIENIELFVAGTPRHVLA